MSDNNNNNNNDNNNPTTDTTSIETFITYAYGEGREDPNCVQ